MDDLSMSLYNAHEFDIQPGKGIKPNNRFTVIENTFQCKQKLIAFTAQSLQSNT